jgi:uncharacterized membrane protein
MLFARLGNPAVAGNFAGQLFEAQSWVAIGCGLILLIHFRTRPTSAWTTASMTSIFLILGALLLALLQQYAVAPRILARDNLKLWHAVGSGMYLVQWLCAGVLLWRMGAPGAQGRLRPAAMAASPPSVHFTLSRTSRPSSPAG